MPALPQKLEEDVRFKRCAEFLACGMVHLDMSKTFGTEEKLQEEFDKTDLFCKNNFCPELFEQLSYMKDFLELTKDHCISLEKLDLLLKEFS